MEAVEADAGVAACLEEEEEGAVAEPMEATETGGAVFQGLAFGAAVAAVVVVAAAGEEEDAGLEAVLGDEVERVAADEADAAVAGAEVLTGAGVALPQGLPDLRLGAVEEAEAEAEAAVAEVVAAGAADATAAAAEDDVCAVVDEGVAAAAAGRVKVCELAEGTKGAAEALSAGDDVRTGATAEPGDAHLEQLQTPPFRFSHSSAQQASFSRLQPHLRTASQWQHEQGAAEVRGMMMEEGMACSQVMERLCSCWWRM